MSSTKGVVADNFIPSEGKRIRTDAKSIVRRRSEKGHSRRTSLEGLPNPSKHSRKDKYNGPPTLILDNGAYTAKIGMSTDENPRVVPNCIMKVKSERKRFFIGNQIDECRDLSGLYYLLPCEKGYTMKWNVQKPVWDYLFNNICSIEDKPVILTQPPFNFKAIQEITDEIFFEEYEIKSMFRANPTDLAKYEYFNNVVRKVTPCIIVDSGFSFTNVIPYIGGKKYYKAARRINVGGKVLTNYLKDIISYRQLHVMDETYVINQVKEDTCYVSLDFKKDMAIAGYSGDQNTIVKNYVLPDFNNIRRGFVQEAGNNVPITEGCQILRLNNERFTVPEILFYPSDIGMESMGIAETIVKSIKLCPPKDQPIIAKNIVLIGGNANFPGFKERLYADVRSYLPDHWTVNVFKPENPVNFAWKGGKSLSEDPKIKSLFITKELYEERGSSYTYERFSDWINTQRSDDQEKKNAAETPPDGILQSSSFTRFDLFGKHEPEAEQESTAKEENTDLDKVTGDLNEHGKIQESSSNPDTSKDGKGINEGESNNSGRNSVVEMQADDLGDLNDKSHKHVKTPKHAQLVNNTNNYNSNCFDTYDFNMFDNSYV